MIGGVKSKETRYAVEAVRPKAISKLSAMFCNHSCMAIASFCAF